MCFCPYSKMKSQNALDAAPAADILILLCILSQAKCPYDGQVESKETVFREHSSNWPEVLAAVGL